jgi:hypothetical protein
MGRYFVPLAVFMLSVLGPGLVSDARAIGAQPEPVERFDANVQAHVFNDSGPCQEHVHIAGTAHAEIDVNRTKEVVEIMISIVADMRGVGVLTGARYIATGAVRKDVATQALPASIKIQADLTWIPLDQCRLPRTMTKKLMVPMVLGVNEAGAITALGIPNDTIFGVH